jgi:hypothetical protein
MGLFKPKKKVPKIQPKPIEEEEYPLIEEEVEEEDDNDDDEEELEEEDHEKYKPQPKSQPVPKKVNKPKWEVGDVVTDTAKVIVNKETGKQYDLYSAVVEILNRTE